MQVNGDYDLNVTGDIKSMEQQLILTMAKGGSKNW